MHTLKNTCRGRELGSPWCGLQPVSYGEDGGARNASCPPKGSHDKLNL